MKAHSRLDGNDVAGEIDRLLEIAKTAPQGPVHIELAGATAQRHVAPAEQAAAAAAGLPEGIEAAGSLIAGARRPVFVIGLEDESERKHGQKTDPRPD